MKKAAIIHGAKGSPNSNWFNAISPELKSDGFEVFIPQFPTPQGQTLENWLNHFHSQVGKMDQDSLLIGHSVGAVFVLRLLEKLESPISTAVLVSGFTGTLGLPEYDNLNESFISEPFNWNQIRRNAKHFICFNGENDPYVPFEQGQAIADSLGVKNHVIKDGGHLNSEFGFSTFPQLLSELTKVELLKKP